MMLHDAVMITHYRWKPARMQSLWLFLMGPQPAGFTVKKQTWPAHPYEYLGLLAIHICCSELKAN